MDKIDERVVELEKLNEEYRFRLLALDMTVQYLSVLINTLAGKGFSAADQFESSFSEVQKNNPENLDAEVLEDLKQEIIKLLGGQYITISRDYQ